MSLLTIEVLVIVAAGIVIGSAAAWTGQRHAAAIVDVVTAAEYGGTNAR